MCTVIIAAGRHELKIAGATKDVNTSTSNSYQAALNAEVPLPGGLGHRPCLMSGLFQSSMAGFNKSPKFRNFFVLSVHCLVSCACLRKCLVTSGLRI